jgi:pantoate--beta-alanine ligase
LDVLRNSRKSIGLVPTLGALHHGHGSLFERARAGCDVVVVSIFVNPLQFGPNEDYLRYPRSLDQDAALCAEKGVDFIFAPETTEMYPETSFTFVDVTRLDQHLCGAHRPGHFRGVATVVLKLLNIVQPDRAYFGEKDYQQFSIIRRMVHDLDLRSEIVAVPTVRESDGLAASSRNAYLSAEQRKAASVLFQALEAARRLVEAGERQPSKAVAAVRRILDNEPEIRVQYVEVVDPVEVQPVAVIDGPVRIAGAVHIGNTRLIDNVAAAPKS